MHRHHISFLSLFVLAGCSSGGGDVTSEPLRERQGGPTRFSALPSEVSGVAFRNDLADAHIKKYLYNGSGVAVGDYDGDGRPDLYMVSLDGPNRLFRQVGDLRFENATVDAGVMGGSAWGTGASFADVDDDGDLDLHVCNLGTPDLLYVNDGDGTFTEGATRAGIASGGASVMSAFADYDRDGDLDFYLLTNRVLAVTEENPQVKAREIDGELTVHPDYRHQYAIIDGHFIEAGQADRLYRNEGDGTFTDVAAASGIEGFDMGLSVTWWDYDEDGWLDIYVCNDLKTRDRLYHNRGDGTFEEVLTETLPYTSWFSMGADIADVDGDGRLDLFVGDMLARSHLDAVVNMGDMDASRWFLDTATPRQYMRNTLFLTTGTERFVEVAFLAGLARTDWTWAVRFADLDNDRAEDLFITTGMERHTNDADWAKRYGELIQAGKKQEARDLLQQMPRLAEHNLVYRNLGGLRFEEVGGPFGLDHVGVTHGAAICDLDRDGDLDVVINNLNDPAVVYRNEGGDGNSVLLDLVGKQSNRDGVGARVTVESAGGRQVRLLTLARGYLSSDEPIVHVGLGNDEKIDRLTIDWPSGTRQILHDLPAGHLHRIVEPRNGVPIEAVAPPAPWFADASGRNGLAFAHVESSFDDFVREPLLPRKLSIQGPAMAWADANGDGVADVYLGGSAGTAGTLLISGPDGHTRAEGPWTSDARAEDVDALFFDADGDGDRDLYVVSGSNEWDAGDAVYRDRLYVNDGAGGFSTARRALPDHTDSGAAVAAADVDGDGDLDLFVGGHAVPGRYPSPAASRLLNNEGGRFVDAGAPPALVRSGIVTGAAFGDIDGDGSPDLLIAREWDALGLYKNEQGRLVDATDGSGLDAHAGLWNALTLADVDDDGDLDVLAANHGQNSRYGASAEAPLGLRHHDFDGDGVAEIVESTFENGRAIPLRGRDAIAAALPFVAERFPTHRAYGSATVGEIFAGRSFERAPLLEVTTLASGVFLNDGTGRFAFRPFPLMAQSAPGTAITAGDLDGDGHVDVYMAQNTSAYRRGIGKLSAGVGVLLAGAGDGTFRLVPPEEVGVVVPDEGREAALVDVGGDERLDVVVATNAGPLRVLENVTGSRGSAGRVP